MPLQGAAGLRRRWLPGKAAGGVRIATIGRAVHIRKAVFGYSSPRNLGEARDDRPPDSVWPDRAPVVGLRPGHLRPHSGHVSRDHAVPASRPVAWGPRAAPDPAAFLPVLA